MNFGELDSLAPERSRQFLSMAFVCQLIQVAPGQLKTLMEATEVRFAEVRDGIGWLAYDDACSVIEKCKEVRQEIHEVSTSHQRN